MLETLLIIVVILLLTGGGLAIDVAAAAPRHKDRKSLCPCNERSGELMIVFGIILLIVAALVSKLAILWGVGIIVLVVGVILAVLGTMGRAVGGRRHYY